MCESEARKSERIMEIVRLVCSELEYCKNPSYIPSNIKDLDFNKAMAMSNVKLMEYNRRERDKIRFDYEISRLLVNPCQETIEMVEILFFEKGWQLLEACYYVNWICHQEPPEPLKPLGGFFNDISSLRMKNNRLQKESLRRFVNKSAKHRRRRRKG